MVHDLVAVAGRRRLRRGADGNDHAVLDDHGLIGAEVVAQAVEQVSASEKLAHGVSLSELVKDRSGGWYIGVRNGVNAASARSTRTAGRAVKLRSCTNRS